MLRDVARRLQLGARRADDGGRLQHALIRNRSPAIGESQETVSDITCSRCRTTISRCSQKNADENRRPSQAVVDLRATRDTPTARHPCRDIAIAVGYQRGVAHPPVEIAYNPLSGGYTPGRIDALRIALERRGAVVRLSPVDGDTITIDAGFDRLCVAGGDGTLRQAVLAAQKAGREVAIGLFPTGTVNLMAIEAGWDTDAEALAERLLGPARRLYYTVSLNDTLFNVCASASPEAWAVARVSPRLKRWIGRFAYAVALLPSLVRWPRHAIRIEVDGRRVDCEAFYVANGRYFAGRWVLSPDARLTEPKLHLVALRTARRLDMARFWTRLAIHRPVDALPFVETIACTAFTAQAGAPLAVQADGDIVTTLPARFEVLYPPLPFA